MRRRLVAIVSPDAFNRVTKVLVVFPLLAAGGSRGQPASPCLDRAPQPKPPVLSAAINLAPSTCPQTAS